MNDDDLDVLERELGPTLRQVLHRVAAEVELDEVWHSRVEIDPPTISLDDRRRDSEQVAIDLTQIAINAEPATARRRGRRHWFVLATAAAVLALVVLALVVADRDDSEPEVPAGPPSSSVPDEPAATALAAAESFSNAWVARDGDAVAALFGPGGTIEVERLPDYEVGLSMVPALHDWFRAGGYEFHAEGCQLVEAAFGVPSPLFEAFCSFTYESDLTRHFNRDPVSVNVWLEMDTWEGWDRAPLRYASGDYFDVDADIGFVFQEWVSTHHPADRDRMYGSPDSTAPRVDPTSIELWDRHLDEFTASAATSSLLADQPQTMAEYGARVRSICATANARFEKERADSRSDGETSEAAARIGSESLTRLRALQPPEPSDQLDAVFSQMEQEITLESRVAAAWHSGDTELTDRLDAELLRQRHQRRGPIDFEYCPMNLGG